MSESDGNEDGEAGRASPSGEPCGQRYGARRSLYVTAAHLPAVGMKAKESKQGTSDSLRPSSGHGKGILPLIFLFLQTEHSASTKHQKPYSTTRQRLKKCNGLILNPLKPFNREYID